MEYRQLGSAGVRVSVIGMGTNQFGGKVDQESVNAIMDEAIDLGINFIDTADVYQKGRSETALGEALKGKREKVVLATKACLPTGDGPNSRGTSLYYLNLAVEKSLERLQTDHIDLYQMHRFDPTTPMEETLRAVDDLVSAGKVRYVGTSNYAAWQLAKANMLAEFQSRIPFVSEQGHFHLFERQVEKEMLPYCAEHNVGFIPFFPLAGGFLTGKYMRGESAPAGSRGEQSAYVQGYMTDENYDKLDQLMGWAGDHGRTINELAHSWLLAQPAVCSVISGLTKIEHLRANAKAGDWMLTADEAAEVTAILDS